MNKEIKTNEQFLAAFGKRWKETLFVYKGARIGEIGTVKMSHPLPESAAALLAAVTTVFWETGNRKVAFPEGVGIFAMQAVSSLAHLFEEEGKGRVQWSGAVDEYGIPIFEAKPKDWAKIISEEKERRRERENEVL